MWPNEYPRLLKDTKKQKDCAARDLVPATLPDMMAWAYVRRIDTGDPTRPFALVHATAGPGDATCEQVCFRFQGIVLNAELGPLGNWREYVSRYLIRICQLSRYLGLWQTHLGHGSTLLYTEDLLRSSWLLKKQWWRTLRSLCIAALGQTAPLVVVMGASYFRTEYSQR